MPVFHMYTQLVYAVFKRLSIRHLMFMGLFFSVFSSLLLGFYGYERIQYFSSELTKAGTAAAQVRDAVDQLRSTMPDGAIPVATAVNHAEALRQHAMAVGKEAQASGQWIVLVMLLCSGAILMIVLNSYLAINVPIRNLVERTRDIAEGKADLTRRLEAMPNTELG